MNLRERLGAFIAFGRASTQPISFLPGHTQFFGLGVAQGRPSTEQLLKGSKGVFDYGARAIANRVSTLPVQVTRTLVVRDGTTATEVIDDHPLKGLLDKPHPNLTRSQLFRLAAQWILIVGECYWLKVNANGLDIPVELHPIPPSQISPAVTGGIVSHYVVLTGDGQRRVLEKELVVRMYWPDPSSHWLAQGLLGPSGNTADILNFTGQSLRAHYQHNQTPNAVLEANDKATEFKEGEREAFYATWKEQYHRVNGENAGAPAMLPRGYKLIELAMQTGSEIKPLLEYLRDDQLMGIGTPRSVLGQVVSGDRSSAEVNQYVFDLQAVTPVTSLMADALTAQLAGDFDENLAVGFVPFLSRDKAHELAREAQDLKTSKRSINMVHTDQGTDPVPWGELPIVPISSVPYDPDLQLGLMADSSDAISDEPREADGEMLERLDSLGDSPREWEWPAARMELVRAHFAPEHEWQRQVLRERTWVPRFATEMRKVFKAQRIETLKQLFATRERAARVGVDDVFDADAWGDVFKKRVDPVRTGAFRAITGETLSGLVGSAEFEFVPSMVKMLERDAAQLVKHANRTTKALLRKQLSAGTAAGESVDQIANRVRNVFSTRAKHARTVARTEILKASQQAQQTGFETSGVVEGKGWNNSGDSDVRDSHEIDGQEVPLGDAFTLGDGERADGPGIGEGGTALSAANTINCRCFMTPVLKLGG